MEKVFLSLISLFVCIFIGYYFSKKKIFTDEFNKGISKFIVNVALPSSILISLQQSFSIDILKKTVVVFIATSLSYIFSILFGVLYTKVFNVEKKEIGIIIFSFTFPNVSFLGIPLISSIYGEGSVLYVSIVTVVFNLLAFTIGKKLLAYGHDTYNNVDLSISVITKNVPIITTLVGLILFSLEIKLPSIILEPIITLAALSSPLAMLLVGSVLGSIYITEGFKNKNFIIVTLFRLIIIPIVFSFIFKIFIDSKYLVSILSILLGMPVASTSVILSEELNSNNKAASLLVFLTTLFSFITIPIITYILTKL